MNSKYDELLSDIKGIYERLESMGCHLAVIHESLEGLRVSDGPDAPKCGHVYEGDPDLPCVREPGHDGTHLDDDDLWYDDEGYYPEPDPMEVGRAMHEAAEAYVGTSDCGPAEPEPKCGHVYGGSRNEPDIEFPCVLAKGHSGQHADKDGDPWDSSTGSYPKPEPAQPTAVDKYLGGSKPKCGNVHKTLHTTPCVLRPGHEGNHVDAHAWQWVSAGGHDPHESESWSDDVKKAMLGCVLGVQVPRESCEVSLGRLGDYVLRTGGYLRTYSLDDTFAGTHTVYTGGETLLLADDVSGEIYRPAWHADRAVVGTIYGPPEGYGLVVENGTVRVGGKS